MKRKIFISLLLVSFFNYIGCSSYHILTEEEIKSGRPNPDDDIKLFLNDSTEIECSSLLNNSDDSLLYLKVIDPKRIISGKGKIIDGKTKKSSRFNGTITSDMIDSKRNINFVSDPYFVVWTKNNDQISFDKEEYLDFYPKFGTGYYIWQNGEFQKRISFEDIQKVSVDQFNFLNTLLLIYGVGAFFLIIFFAATGGFEGGGFYFPQ
jgi:hypothetical protein